MQTGAPERNSGCGIAALAQLTDTDYNRIRELAPALCEKCGVHDDTVMWQFLSEHGYALQMKWEFREYDEEKLEEWPPKPWAERHLCSVVQTAKDVYGHYVAMDAKGVVYDPALEQFAPKTLGDYYTVEWVAGLYKVGNKP